MRYKISSRHRQRTTDFPAVLENPHQYRSDNTVSRKNTTTTPLIARLQSRAREHNRGQATAPTTIWILLLEFRPVARLNTARHHGQNRYATQFCRTRGSHPSPPTKNPATRAGLFIGWRTRITRATRSPCGPASLKYMDVQMLRSTRMCQSDQLRCSKSLRNFVEPEVLTPVRQLKTPPQGRGFLLAGGLGLLALRARPAGQRR